MKRYLAVTLCAALAGCAFLPTLRDVQDVNDRAIAAWKTAGCAFPLSAIQRNPEIIPALNILCKPPGSADAHAVTK